MATDLAGLADVVVLTIKSALAPVLERLASTEQANRDLQARVNELTGMRDRLVTVETKMAAPVVESAPVVDLSPALERIAGAEARLSVLGDLRDRVVTMETKAATLTPAAPVDLTPVVERCVGLEARVGALDTVKDELRELREEIQEQARAIPEVFKASSEYRSRVEALEAKAQLPAGPSVAEQELALVNRLDPVVKQLAALSERQAALEARPLVPGPAGEPGADGKNGVDGLGFDDLMAVQEDDRSLSIKAVRGDIVKTIGTVRFPVEMYRGDFLEGKSYERGDCVTWSGSEWHCNDATTTKPGDGSKAWTLKVKRGRDGRDGKDAAPPIPVLSVGRT